VSDAVADIYRFIDEDGVLHLTDTPPDSRYKLYLTTAKVPSAMAETLNTPRLKRIPETSRAKYQAHIVAAAKTFALEPELLHAVISAESAYNPLARSSKGARGLMQLMPDTARRYGVANAYDPAQNIVGGAAYLKDLLTLFGNDLQLAIAAYNAGEGRIMEHGYKVPPYRETMLYVPKVLGYYRRYKGTL
jgi:soluble lytic murein transglycosylase-like protein